MSLTVRDFTIAYNRRQEVHVSLHPGSKADVRIGGERFVLDEYLNRILREGVPAVLEACRHTRQVIKHDTLFLVSDQDGGIYNGCNCGTGASSTV